MADMTPTEYASALQFAERNKDDPEHGPMARELLRLDAKAKALEAETKALKAEIEAKIAAAIARARKRCRQRKRLGVLDDNDIVPTKKALREGLMSVDAEGRAGITPH